MTYGLAQSQNFLHALEIVRVKQATKLSHEHEHEHDAIASTPNAAASMKDIKWMGVNGQTRTFLHEAPQPVTGLLYPRKQSSFFRAVCRTSNCIYIQS